MSGWLAWLEAAFLSPDAIRSYVGVGLMLLWTLVFVWAVKWSVNWWIPLDPPETGPTPRCCDRRK